MTEQLLELIPQYGLWIIFITVALACIGIPLPASVLLLTSSALAAAGDLNIWQLMSVTLLAYIIGDQAAFNTARFLGSPLLDRLRNIGSNSSRLDYCENLINRYGLFAVVISRTLISPVGPWVGYISGAMRMSWLAFTLAATSSAALWVIFYCLIGYGFAGELPQVSDLIAGMLLVGISGVFTFVFAIWIYVAWNRFLTEKNS